MPLIWPIVEGRRSILECSVYLACGVLLGVALTGSALAQEEAEAEPDSSSIEEEFVPEGEVEANDDSRFEEIDDLLALDEEVLSDPGTYTYDPGDRRDPFRSLQNRRGPDVPEERPEGPAGLLIDEISVEGVFILPEGPAVQVQSASQETSYLLREGDQLWDGDVVRIGMEEIVFKQSVNDPTALKPFREVVKKLN